MSDRFNALTVVLDKDIRSEDAEPLMLIRFTPATDSIGEEK